MQRTFLLSCLFLLTFVSSASAATIDFRQNFWHAAHNQNTFDYDFTTGVLDGLSLNIEAGPNGARIWQDGADGFGVIKRWENDEIEWDETLKLTFSDDVTLNTLSFADLFKEGHTETGRYSTDFGNSWTEFRAITHGNNGQLTLNIGDILTDSIWFSGTMRGGHEFAVQQLGLTYAGPTPPPPGPPPTEVPEPATMLLLAGGMLGAGVKRKIKKA